MGALVPSKNFNSRRNFVNRQVKFYEIDLSFFP